MTKYSDLNRKLRAVHLRIVASVGGADAFRANVLDKLPVVLDDESTLAVAQELGWREEWLQRAAKAKQPAAPNRNVAQMLASVTGPPPGAVGMPAPRPPPVVRSPAVAPAHAAPRAAAAAPAPAPRAAAAAPAPRAAAPAPAPSAAVADAAVAAPSGPGASTITPAAWSDYYYRLVVWFQVFHPTNKYGDTTTDKQGN